MPRLALSALYVDRLLEVLSRDTDRVCLRHLGRDITAAELLSKIYCYARALGARGIRQGDVVALFAPNSPEALAVRYAANLIGAGATFLSAPDTAEARRALIEAIAPALLVIFPETVPLLPVETTVPVAGVGFTPSGGLNLSTVTTNSNPIDCQAEPDDLAVIVSSVGSTGVPKGSWRTFAAYSSMVSVPSPSSRRQLINGPLAYLSQVLTDITLLGGGSVVFRDRYEAVDTATTIEAERITDLFLVEPQLFEFMDHPVLASTDLSSLKTLTHIGASAPPTLRLRAREKLGSRVVHTYGASEEGLVSVLTAAEDDPANPEHFHSAGRVLPNVDVRFRRPDGTLAAPGETGSIEIRSRSMAQGYRNLPDLEAVAFRDGWYRSGDLGRIDADGYLHIFGRAMDIVFQDGHMVSPMLIEDTLCRVPGIRYVSVVVDLEFKCWIAAIVPRIGTSIDEAMCSIAVGAEHGSDVAQSLKLVACDAVPLTPQGKPDREQIRLLGRLLAHLPRQT